MQKKKKKNALLDVKQPIRLCYKDHHFTRVPEEGMISYSWLFDEHTNCTGKNSAFDFVNGGYSEVFFIPWLHLRSFLKEW